MVQFLVESLLNFLLDQQVNQNPILPVEVEEGTLLVQRNGADWAVALSRRHRRRLRHDPSLTLDASITTTHNRAPATVWGSIEGNGYCGYDTIRHMLLPGVASFRLADPSMRSSFQQFLQQLILWIPVEMSEDIGRVKEAVQCLNSPRMLPRTAWCHMDLVMYFADREHCDFWVSGGTPLHSTRWLGQRNVPSPSLHCRTLGAAFNGRDHFTVVTPDIPPEQHAEAIRMLELAHKGEPLPHAWLLVEGTKPFAPLSPPITLLSCPDESQQLVVLDAPPPQYTSSPWDRTKVHAISQRLQVIPPNPPTPKKEGALLAVKGLLQSRPRAQVSLPRRPARNQSRPSYTDQLFFPTTKRTWNPVVTPPLPPREELTDPTAMRGALYLATSRLGFSLQGVFAKRDIPYTPRSPHRLCEFRSERGNTRTDTQAHADYMARADCTMNVVIRGPILVDGHGNANSYCTFIQENLRVPHFNCEYVREGGKI